MKKILKISGMLGILSIFIFLSFGCRNKVEMVRANTPEEAINSFNRYISYFKNFINICIT